MSLELPADWKQRVFDDYYPKSRARIWRGDLRTGRVEELCHRERLSPFYSPCCLLPGEGRIAVTALIGGKSVLYTMDLDGGRWTAITGPDEFVYGVSLSPRGERFAFHSNYRIHVCGTDGSDRREIAAAKGQLYFGSSWSPDGEWILFQTCDSRADPAHDWSRIGIARPAGSELRWLTPPAAAWFGASYGTRGNPGGGSNQPQWAPDGSGVLYVKRIAGAKTPWEFQAARKDTDHFNRDYRPELARGGTHLALHDPRTGEERALTKPIGGVWDFRAAWSPDGRGLAFLRARQGEHPELCVRSHGLTRGLRGYGAEHPAWIPRCL